MNLNGTYIFDLVSFMINNFKVLEHKFLTCQVIKELWYISLIANYSNFYRGTLPMTDGNQDSKLDQKLFGIQEEFQLR